MKTIMNIFPLLILLILTNGCSDIDAGLKPASTFKKFDGVWDVSGRTKVASREDAGNCGYGVGSGFLDISGKTVIGEIVDDSGYSYELEGSIDESGKITGAFTYVGYDAAAFDGQLAEIEGGGAWQDINGCPGNWQVKRRALIDEKSKEPS